MEKLSEQDLTLASYDYFLPESLVAIRPQVPRDRSRLLFYRRYRDALEHHYFDSLAELLPPGALLVLNHSKVFPCRLFGRKKSGGKCQIMLLSLPHKKHGEQGVYPVLINCRGKKNVGDVFEFSAGVSAIIREVYGDGTFGVVFSCPDLLAYLEKEGSVPIPSYIRDGTSDERDLSDYQTVYAKEAGSVAAPTAGLHFTPEVFSDLEAKGVQTCYLTLHVGLGTFSPVSVDQISRHKMHSEVFKVSKETLAHLNRAGQEGRPIFAVGTTVLRVLESIFDGSEFVCRPDTSLETDIFIHPGKSIAAINGMITNFHLPRSTPLMLVSALIGREKTLQLYQEAKESNYRFYSYGDAMLLDLTGEPSCLQ